MYENGAAGSEAFGASPERSGPRRGRGRPSRAPAALSWRLAAGGLVALPALLGAVWLAASLIDPAGPLGASSPLSSVHDARAQRLLGRPAPGPADLKAADAESLTSLAVSPADDSAWLALAYAETVRHGDPGGVALGWLQRSYDVAPFGPDTSLWRVRFALDHWQAMTPDLRREVLDEINAAWRPRRRELVTMVSAVRDPAGRLALALMIVHMRTEDTPSSLSQ